MRPMQPTAPLELEPGRLLTTLRPALESLLRRRQVPPAAAVDLLTAAAVRIESRLGPLPGAKVRLLRACNAVCRRIGPYRRSPAAVGGEADAAADYRRAFATARARLRRRRRRYEVERAAAPRLAAELLALPPAARDRALSRRRFRSLALAEHLLDESWRTWTEEPARGEPLAGLALCLLDGLTDRERARHGHGRLDDLRAVGWIYVANARRILFDHRGAEAALATAEGLLVAGTGDPRERALLLLVKGTLRRAQRCFVEALGLLAQAAAIHRWTGDHHEEGKLLVSQAIVHDYAGDPQRAIPLVHRALELIDPARDPRLALVAHHNLAAYFIATGRYREAQERLPEVRRRTAELGGRLEALLVRWLDGMLAVKLGRVERGEEILAALRDEYLNEGMTYNAALVSLELVALFLDQRRSADASRLAAELIPVFSSRNVHREAIAALLALHQAAEQGAATVSRVQEVAGLLRRLRASGPPRSEAPS